MTVLSEGKNLSPHPPLSMSLNGITRHLVVANESTGSHPQDDVTSWVLVENKSTGSHSSTGTSAAFDVANGSTGSQSSTGTSAAFDVANGSTGSQSSTGTSAEFDVANGSTGSQSSTGTSAAFDVANGSTGSHSKTGASAALAVANGSTGYHSNTGASAALDVANVSTRSDSKSVVLSEADTETEIASVENRSATCSSLGDSLKEGSDHTDSPNQNHVPKYGRRFDTTDVHHYTSVRAGNGVDELRIGLPVNSSEGPLEPSYPLTGHKPFSKDIYLPDHNQLLRLSPTIVQRNTHRQTSSDAFKNEPCDDEFSPTGARRCISDDIEHVNFMNVNNCGPVRHSVIRVAKEHHARREPISASPAQYWHSGTDPNWSMGNGHSGHVNDARREPISASPAQYWHSGTDPNWSMGNGHSGHVNDARGDPISETPAQDRHSETDPNWSMGNGHSGHVNDARGDLISETPAQYWHSGTDPNWSMGNGHSGHVNDARREPSSASPAQYWHSGTDPNCSMGNGHSGHVNDARGDPISETPAQDRHSETDPNWSIGDGGNSHVNAARRDPTSATPSQYRLSGTDPNWSIGNGHNGQVNSAFDDTSITSWEQQRVPGNQAHGLDEDQSFNREESTLKTKGLKVCLPIAAMTVGLGLLALIVTLSITPDKLFATKASVQMRVDDTFEEQMANTSSESSFYYGEKFCHNVKDAVKQDMTMQSCKVTGLRKGSIIVEFEASLLTTQSYTAQELEDLFRRNGTGNSQLTSFGLVQAFTDSIKVLSLETREIPSEDAGGVTTPGEFDCSEKGEYYLPFPYTFPLYCGEYQLCTEGKSTASACEVGLEYGDNEGNTGSPCHQPSNFTYCGEKSFPKNAGTTSTNSLTTSMEATTATTSVQSTSGPVTVGTSSPAMLCSNVDPRIMSNVSSMYECPKTGAVFVPRDDTYPNNCATYNWCLDGTVISDGDFHCAEGSSFILRERPCETDGDEDNFCEQMQRAEWCRKNGWTEADTSTTSVPVAQIPTTCTGFTNDFIPVNDTYPDHCAKYQQCVHGKAFQKSCPHGLHFSHIGQPCVKSDDSENYCNKREQS